MLSAPGPMGARHLEMPVLSTPTTMNGRTQTSGAGSALSASGDRREVLAAERTFLAWIRTCLALVAGGAALGTFPVLPYPTVRAVLGVACMSCAGVLAVSANRSWGRARRARSGDPYVPGPRAAQLLTAAVVVAALALTGPSVARLLGDAPHHPVGSHRARHWQPSP